MRGYVIGSEEFKLERARVEKLWKELPSDEKIIYDGLASEMDNEKDKLFKQNDYASIQAKKGVMPKRAVLASKTNLARAALDDIDKHPAWKSGFGLSGPATALRPEFMLEGPVGEYVAQARSIFTYDEKEVQNPPTQTSRACCRRLYHGLCAVQHEATLEQVRICVHNIHVCLLERKFSLSHNNWPFPVRLSIGDDPDDIFTSIATEWLLLAIDIGKGEAQIMISLEKASGTRDTSQSGPRRRRQAPGFGLPARLPATGLIPGLNPVPRWLTQIALW